MICKKLHIPTLVKHSSIFTCHSFSNKITINNYKQFSGWFKIVWSLKKEISEVVPRQQLDVCLQLLSFSLQTKDPCKLMYVSSSASVAISTHCSQISSQWRDRLSYYKHISQQKLVIIDLGEGRMTFNNNITSNKIKSRSYHTWLKLQTTIQWILEQPRNRKLRSDKVQSSSILYSLAACFEQFLNCSRYVRLFDRLQRNFKHTFTSLHNHKPHKRSENSQNNLKREINFLLFLSLYTGKKVMRAP